MARRLGGGFLSFHSSCVYNTANTIPFFPGYTYLVGNINKYTLEIKKYINLLILYNLVYYD